MQMQLSLRPRVSLANSFHKTGQHTCQANLRKRSSKFACAAAIRCRLDQIDFGAVGETWTHHAEDGVGPAAGLVHVCLTNVAVRCT